MRRFTLLFNGFIILVLVLAALGSTTVVALAANKDPKADPRLLQMAADNPDATFMVIIQKDAKNKDLKDTEVQDEVLKGGGQVKKQLDMIVSFSAELTGKEITRLAKHPKVRWITADAPMVSAATTAMETVRDNFTSQSYNGNDGTSTWTTNWTESGETTSPTSGLFQVITSSKCSGGSGSCLRIDPTPSTSPYSINRQADLSGMVSVWLSFYRDNELNAYMGTSEEVLLQVSPDGGNSWVTLQTYSSRALTGSATDSFDISAYAGSNTQIRFLISKSQPFNRFLWIDNVQIAFARPSAYLPTIKADQPNLTGSGVTVAVVDSGITAGHPDFATGNQMRVVYQTSFGQNGGFQDLQGHGTHVAGILGGSGAASSGQYKGVAPGVNLVSLRVSDKNGMAFESSVVDSLQWIYNNKDTYNIKVVNLSLNSTVAQSYQTSPLDAAVEILWLNGITVVVSAGNNGTGTGPVTIYPPANDPFVITVGATEDKGTSDLTDDTLAVFSAYGSTDDGFAKPDLVAPGRNVVAPLSDKVTTIYTDHPLNRVNDYYFRMSGTSMSAPMVSGAVALLLQEEPKLNPDQIKYRLMATANQTWNAYSASQSGAGCLDVAAAVNGSSTQSANTGIVVSQLLSTGSTPITWDSVGWNSVGWNSVGWNSVGWNSVGWNSVGWNSVGWNSNIWDQ